MKKHAVVIEEGPANYSASVLALPGCVSTGRTLAEFHIEGMIEDGDPIPEPSAHAIEVEVSVA